MYALLVGEAVGRAIEEQQREWAGVDGRKFRVGKRTEPLSGVVVADVESGGGSLRRLHSRRRGGDDNGWVRQTAADGGDQRWRLALSFVVVCCVVDDGGQKLCFPPCPCVPLSSPPLFLPPSPSSFVISPPKKCDRDF